MASLLCVNYPTHIEFSDSIYWNNKMSNYPTLSQMLMAHLFMISRFGNPSQSVLSHRSSPFSCFEKTPGLESICRGNVVQETYLQNCTIYNSNRYHYENTHVSVKGRNKNTQTLWEHFQTFRPGQS